MIQVALKLLEIGMRVLRKSFNKKGDSKKEKRLKREKEVKRGV